MMPPRAHAVDCEIPTQPDEFADELGLLLADAVWAIGQRDDQGPGSNLVTALAHWRDHPMVSRAAALAVDKACYPSPGLEDLQLALLRAARGAWLADPAPARRVRILRQWSEQMYDSDRNAVAAELLDLAITLCDNEIVDDRVTALTRLAPLLLELLDVLDDLIDAEADDPAPAIERGADAARRLVAINTELVRMDRGAYLRDSAEAHTLAGRFITRAQGAAAGVSETAAGVRAWRELAETAGPAVAPDLDRAWTEHIALLERAGDDRGARESDHHRIEVLRGHVGNCANASQDVLSQLAELLRENSLYTEAVAVSARVVAYVTDLAADTDILAVRHLSDVLRRHGEYLHRADRRAEALEHWRRCADLRQQVHRVEGESSIVAEGLATIADLAHSLDDLPVAVDFGGAAIDEWTRLATLDPGRYLPLLTDELCVRANRLAELNRGIDACVAVEQAVAAARGLVRLDSRRYLPILSATLTRATTLHVRFWRSEAGPRSLEAVEVAERLADSGTGDYTADLAEALHNRALALNWYADYRQSSRMTARAVTLYEGLVDGDLDYRGSLANVLCTRAATLGKLGEVDAALESAKQAEFVYSGLAEQDSMVYCSEFAYALNLQAALLLDRGDVDTAGALAQDALAIGERLQPGSDQDEQRAMALHTINRVLTRTGRAQEAVACSESLLELRERMAVRDPVAETAELAVALGNHAVSLSAAGDPRGALAPAERAVQLFRELFGYEPGPYRKHLGEALDRYALFLGVTLEHEHALEVSAEAIAHFESLPDRDDASNLPELAICLENHAQRLDAVDQATEARSFGARALATFAACEGRRDTMFHGQCLLNQAGRLSGVGDYSEALDHATRAVALLEELTAESGTCMPELAQALHHQSLAMDGLGRHEESVCVQERAVRIAESCAAVDRLAALDLLARVTHNLARRLVNAEQWPRARDSFDAAIQLWEELAELDRDLYLRELAGVLDECAAGCGNNGEWTESVGYADRAVAAFAELLASDHGFGYVDLLRDSIAANRQFATALHETRQYDAAVPAIEETVRQARLLVEIDGTAQSFGLADALREQAWLCFDAGLRTDSVAAGRAALAVLEEAIAVEGGDHRAELADYLDSLADSLAAAGQPGAALEYNDRALPIWEELAEESDEPSLDVAWSLWHRARWRALVGGHAGVLDLSARAVTIYENAGVTEDSEADENGAGVLTDHAKHLADAGQHAEAVKISARAVKLWELLAADDPKHGPRLDECLRAHASYSS
ncbi:tetratricopeptide repeat protein [Nocardia sp. NPDC127579]|uniref:tetratricopeptide repeat protein n=1 Tax=Nocardia sp. NPDC127579 TaxID=3345402 RepID=UPI00363B7CE5